MMTSGKDCGQSHPVGVAASDVCVLLVVLYEAIPKCSHFYISLVFVSSVLVCLFLFRHSGQQVFDFPALRSCLLFYVMASIMENPDDFFSPALPECRANSQPSLPQFIISW